MAAILIVDDSIFLRKRAKEALKEEGYTIREAGSGVSALAALSEETFGCVLTDLVMPELDGFGLLSEIRQRAIQVPVLVLTADIQKTTRAKCEELGACQILNKPVDPAVLRSAVARAMAGGGE